MLATMLARPIDQVTSDGIRGILVDLDETLHSRETAFWTWIELEARHAGVAATLDRARIAALDARGRGEKAKLLSYLDGVFQWGSSSEERFERFRVGLSAFVKLNAGVRDSLVRLGREYRLGLITNGTGATQRAKLSSLAVEGLFDPIIISGEVGFRKPDARIFELGMASWGLPREAVLFVGDDPVSDIQGAREAGMRALRVGGEDGIPSFLILESWLQAQVTVRG
jgi:putative hydrolase of the HAD superfamily